MQIFIGSSQESLQTANYIKSLLNKIGYKCTVWNEIGTFIPSLYTIQNMLFLNLDFLQE